MSVLSKFLIAASLVCSTAAHAGLISGFENGLQGWDYIGDTSVQNSSIGLAPTQGQNFAFLTTIGPLLSDLTPYSGTPSPYAGTVRTFLGVETAQIPGYPGGEYYMPDFPSVGYEYGMVGDGAAIRTQFTVNHAGYVSFDWNRIGSDGDNDYFTIWNDDLGTRINGWIFLYGIHTYDAAAGANAGGFLPVDVGLCSHTTSLGGGCAPYDVQTGWNTMSVWIDTPGTYNIGFGMNEIAEWTAPTVLALDNVRFNVVPEPSSVALMGLAAAGLGFARRRKHKN